MMPTSPIVESALTQSHYLSKPSHSAESCSDREILSHNSSLEESNLGDEAGSFGSCTRSNNDYSSRFQLQQDVQRLQQQLQEEMELHAILEKAIQKNALKFSSPSRLPHQAQELLSNISLLEITVSKLEQEMVSLHFQLSQERNERRLAEYHLRHSTSQSISLHSSDIMDTSNAVDSIALGHDKKMTMKMDSNSFQPLEFSKLSKGMPSNGLWNYPNQLSEEMVRCMKNIFMSLADSTVPSKTSASESHCSPLSPHGTSPRGHLSSSSWWSSSERSMISSWLQSPQIDIQSNSEVVASDNACDPYRVRRKLSWANIGNYGLATEVSWMSVGKKQLEYASGALRRFRTLVEQLAKVNPIRLSCDEKLAFWINLYNALIMHAYLAYGVPRSDLKLFSLLQKAAYTVGGHSFSAAAIEYVILKMKPPLHRPQIALLLALHKLKVSEEQRESAVDIYEPLVAFALSCGMYSSPAVRIYTAQNVREELQEAQRDFIRASVGVSSKGRLLVPKMLHCFAKAFVDDANLAVWILHYLPPHQATFVEQCISQRRQSLLGSRNCGILPFDSRFRYLFLPDKIPLC
ncbi:hypothetical protein I3843_01G201400 [Carya illinoinensis]|uniref:Uncharacterized protein n=1 Tax=Carya illinoinensis TaxID=32201 RepID=A0A922G9G2_CARIL|nr:hypothetical protein I3842_01G209400 [Carya illinoinensis]KAG7997228.1 hypothetical protein I3843_01G201400 [Carya illinoinensis]